jgi:hypothetical protein
VASLAGVKYNVIYSYGKDGQPHDPPVRRLEEVTITPLLTTPVARAFLVRKYRILPSAEILGTMQESGFDPEHEVILEKSPTGLGASIDLPVVGSATIISREANKVVIETASEHEAILVLSDSYYPGWQAEIDGVEVETLRADYVFRGVPLPEGRHTVVFKFRPRSFFFGAMISCAGVIAWLCWALFFWVRRWVFPLRR